MNSLVCFACLGYKALFYKWWWTFHKDKDYITLWFSLPVIFLAMTQRPLLKTKKRHDKSLEAYKAALAKYKEAQTKLLDSIETQHENELAEWNFKKADYAFKLYNRMHQDELLISPREPKFSDFYQPSALQKRGELIFVGLALLRSDTLPFDSCSQTLKTLSQTLFHGMFDQQNKFFQSCPLWLIFLFGILSWCTQTKIGQKPNTPNSSSAMTISFWNRYPRHRKVFFAILRADFCTECQRVPRPMSHQWLLTFSLFFADTFYIFCQYLILKWPISWLLLFLHSAQGLLDDRTLWDNCLY